MCFISNKSQSLQIKRFLKTSHINALQTCLKNGFVHRISNWKINSKNNCRNIRAKFLPVQSCSGPVFVSVGVMFLISGLIRFIIGPNDQSFNDGTRFIMKARAFKEMTGLSEGSAIKTSQGVTVMTAFVIVIFLFWFYYSK